MTFPISEDAILRNTLRNSTVLLEDMRGQLAGFERAKNLEKVYAFREGIEIIKANIKQNADKLERLERLDA